MKTIYFVLLSVVLSASLWCDSASAYVARRSAVVAQGPYGGTVVAASRTAIGGRRFGFLASEDQRKSQSQNSAQNLCEPHVKPTTDVKVSH